MALDVARPRPAAVSVKAGGDQADRARTYLMCAPTYFAVTYQINPWMRPDKPVDQTRAAAQWDRVREQLLALGHLVHLVAPQPELPDMVFAANGGILIGDRALVPRFRHAERRGESVHFAQMMADLGIREVRQARHVNEGEGDFILIGDQILAGTGFRSDPRAADEVAEYFELPVVPLRLVDPRFYHLDTALARLTSDTIAYWPGAFDAASRVLLQDLFPGAIRASEADAACLGLNMISDGSSVIMTPRANALARRLTDRGFHVLPVATDELGKAGGGAKCCVLEHHRVPQSRA